jgi:hypothetical protein
MPIRTNLWKVNERPTMLHESSLPSELQLEDMIVREPKMLSDEWMLIGRQERTSFGKYVDLLAIAPDGSLVVIELKRDRTPREVVAQSLDYASWVEKLEPEDIAEIYGRFNPGKELAQDFYEEFGQLIDEDELNQNHQIIIVAAQLDDSTERIVSYLNERGVSINVLFFQIFSNGEEQLLSRTWLLDPVHTQTAAAKSLNQVSEPWNGEFYCSFGHGESRSWLDAIEYGFVCGGGGAWYSRTLQLLNPGDRVWVKVPSVGFVGVGHVIGKAQPASEFKVSTPDGERPVLEVATRGSYHRNFIEDEERCEYFVPIKWLDTVSLENAVQEVGMFGNQNTVCKPTAPKWRSTVDRLKVRFPKFDAIAPDHF